MRLVGQLSQRDIPANFCPETPPYKRDSVSLKSIVSLSDLSDQFNFQLFLLGLVHLHINEIISFDISSHLYIPWGNTELITVNHLTMTPQLAHGMWVRSHFLRNCWLLLPNVC